MHEDVDDGGGDGAAVPVGVPEPLPVFVEVAASCDGVPLLDAPTLSDWESVAPADADPDVDAVSVPVELPDAEDDAVRGRVSLPEALWEGDVVNDGDEVAERDRVADCVAACDEAGEALRLPEAVGDRVADAEPVDVWEGEAT